MKQAEERERRASLLESFLSYAQESLFNTGTTATRDYLVKRGFLEHTQRELGLGMYSSPADVKIKLLAQGFSEDEIYDSMILGTKDKTKEGWDALSGRIVGAFGRNYGRLISVWAGYVDSRPPKGGPPPYITLGPRNIPFGFDDARRLGKKDLLLVEGPIKALLPYSLGLDDPFPIASGGDLTDDQIRTIEGYLRHSGSLTINWDYDDAAEGGVHARTLRTLDRLSNASFRVYVVNPCQMAQGVSDES
jgi:DNA primase